MRSFLHDLQMSAFRDLKLVIVDSYQDHVAAYFCAKSHHAPENYDCNASLA